MALPYTAKIGLHCTALLAIRSPCIEPHYLAMQQLTLHCIAWGHNVLHCTALRTFGFWSITLHYITLPCIDHWLPSIALHCFTSHPTSYITYHGIAIGDNIAIHCEHYDALHWTRSSGIAFHCTTFHCTALHCSTLNYAALQCITSHCVGLHYSTLDCIALCYIAENK